MQAASVSIVYIYVCVCVCVCVLVCASRCGTYVRAGACSVNFLTSIVAAWNFSFPPIVTYLCHGTAIFVPLSHCLLHFYVFLSEFFVVYVASRTQVRAKLICRIQSLNAYSQFFTISAIIAQSCPPMFSSYAIAIIQGVSRNTFHDFSSTCDNLTKKCFK